MATSVVASGPISATGSPPARLKNTRYVGALSRNEESAPVIQKYSASCGLPSGPLIVAINGASTPSLPARSIAIAGAIVTKMPAKSFATSTIGAKPKWFAWRTRFGVRRHDAHASASSPASRATFCSSSVVP